MTFFLHVRRNISRNKGRTIGVMMVVGVTLGMFLILGQVSSSVIAYTDQVVASVPNIIQVQPSGARTCTPLTCSGGGVTVGGNAPQDIGPSSLKTISSTPDVEAVQRVWIGMSNASAIRGSHSINGEPPGVSDCQAGNQLEAEDTTSSVKLLLTSSGSGAGTPTITSGRNLDASDENSTNALVGQQYATDNHLSVGDELTLNGHAFRIVGIFAGNACYGDIVIVPFAAGTAAYGVANPVQVFVYVNSHENVDSVATSLQDKFGDSYSVIDLAQADYTNLQNAISSILFSSQFGEYAALAAGTATMVIVMILVTSRRTKEVGLLKALGYSGARILGQVLSESLILAVVGFPIAILLSLLVGPSIAQLLLGQFGGAGSGPAPTGGNSTNVGGGHWNPFLQGVIFSLTPGTVLLGVEITLIFGILGAAIPAIEALLLRPSEALRHE